MLAGVFAAKNRILNDFFAEIENKEVMVIDQIFRKRLELI